MDSLAGRRRRLRFVSVARCTLPLVTGDIRCRHFFPPIIVHGYYYILLICLVLPVLLVILLVELPDSSHLVVSSFLDSRSSAPHTPRRRGLSNHYLHYCMHDSSLILPSAFHWRRLVFFFSAGRFCPPSLLTASLPSFCASGIPRSFAFTALSLAFPRGSCGLQFF